MHSSLGEFTKKENNDDAATDGWDPVVKHLHTRLIDKIEYHCAEKEMEKQDLRLKEIKTEGTTFPQLEEIKRTMNQA